MIDADNALHYFLCLNLLVYQQVDGHFKNQIILVSLLKPWNLALNSNRLLRITPKIAPQIDFRYWWGSVGVGIV